MDLKARYPKSGVRASTIKSINESEYKILQTILREDISKAFSDAIVPVQYDDIMWNTLNRKKA